MKFRTSTCPAAPAYSFAEVLVASGLLGLAIGAAVSLTATFNTQHASAKAQSVASNFHENGARLWQLGLSDSDVLTLLPDTRDNADLANALLPSSSVANRQLTFSAGVNVVLSNSMGVVEKTTCTATMRNPVGASNRNVALDVYRPLIR